MTEDRVVEAIKELVAAGEYLDTIPGVPGARLSGGGVFQDDRRLYVRGSPEHLEARDSGLVERLPPLTRAPPEAVDEAERLIGFPMPSPLRRLYLEVGNGGFGPGYGILGLRDGHGDDYRHTAIELYPWERHERLLPVCYWGCAIYSFVDAEAGMWACDPNPGAEDDLFAEPMTLAKWLERWVDCRLNQSALIEDPRTGRFRPATNEDWAEWA